MYMRMKTKKNKWEKVEVNMVDFICFNFVAGLVTAAGLMLLVMLMYLI